MTAMQHAACGLREVKFASDDSAMTFSGYGAVFGNVDSYGDVIQRGAFRETLAAARKSGNWPSMLAQHGGFSAEDMMPIGVWTTMEEDDAGLKLEGRLADTTRGREAHALLKMQPRPALNGLSIGYIAKEWSVRTRPDEPRRTLKAVELLEVSLVTFPANPKARVTGVKAADMTERELERVLTQDARFTRSEARALMRGGLPALKAMRDAGDDGGEPGASDALRRALSILKS